MQTIEITTPQNVTIEYELSSLKDRFFAYLIDLIVVFLTYYLFIFLVVSFAGDIIWESFTPLILFMLLPIGGFILYHLLSEIITSGQSLGKKALGLRVIRLDGEEPGIGDYLIRAVFLIIDWSLSGGTLAGLFIGSSTRKQRLGDLAAHTTVIRERSEVQFKLADILSIESMEAYQPIYPQATKFSEQDMLLVKNLLYRIRQYPNEAHQQAVGEAVVYLCKILDINEPPRDKIGFLRTVIKDYIVLTR